MNIIRQSLLFAFFLFANLNIFAQQQFADVIIDQFYNVAGNLQSPVFYGSDPVTGCNWGPKDPTVCLGNNSTFISVPNGSYVTVGFVDNIIVNAPGQDDLFIDEIGAASELATIWVSTDFGLTFTELGTIDGGITNAIDFDDFGFNGCVNAVKIQGTDKDGCVPGFDIVRIYGLPGANLNFTTQSAKICEGESYEGYSTEGIYRDTFVSRFGCDSIRTINLRVGTTNEGTDEITICDGENIEGHTSSGIYLDTLETKFFGCDSFRLLTLTVKPPLFSELNMTICEGEEFLGYNASGVYEDVFMGTDGCDSSRFLILDVLPNSSEVERFTICEGEDYKGFTETGQYQTTFTAANGCDSFFIIDLNVILLGPHESYTEICRGESFRGYTETGVYQETLKNRLSCDSIVNFNVEVIEDIETQIDTVICEGFELLGYTDEGIHIDNFIGFRGCDSIRILDLELVNEIPGSRTVSLCPGEDFKGVTESGLFYDTIAITEFCDSIISVEVTANQITMPNVFSPNGDNINDLFPIGGSAINLPIKKWVIFDRWGNKVHSKVNFFSGDQTNWWDGKFDGSTLMPGVYGYYIEMECKNTIVPYKGDVTIVR